MERPLCQGERGHFAMRERHELLGNINRGAAGGISRIASQMLHPVYPRQHEKDSGSRRGGIEP